MSSPNEVTRGGFAITVPDSWYEIAVQPATRDASINALVEARIHAVPELAEHRTALIRILRAVARDAHASGAVYCGAMAEDLDGAVLTASVTVSMIRAVSGGRALDTDPDAIVASLSQKQARNEDDTWRSVHTVELPGAGPAARAFGVEDVELPEDAGWVRVALTYTFVSIPGTDRVALVSCSSPNLDLASEFHDLFDAITSTFRFIAGAQPDGASGAGGAGNSSKPTGPGAARAGA